MKPGPTVFIVEDDEGVRESVRALVESVNRCVETFASAEDFLTVYDPAREGCLVVDVRLPGMSGLDLQQAVGALGWSIPVIMLTGHGDIEMAVEAMKAGAVSFLEKPFKDQRLLDAIHEAIEKDVQNRRIQAKAAEIQALFARLTVREQEVMELLVAGNMNKEVAAKLQVSQKTVEIHRSHLMKKLQADTVADLVRLAYLSGAIKGNS